MNIEEIRLSKDLCLSERERHAADLATDKAIGKMIEHFEEDLEYRKLELEQVIEAIHKELVPDIVSRRVVETECLMLSLAIRTLKRLLEEK